ncbi:MAG: hypothetical protein ACI8XO_003599 [Verrucomicrobiales bacterium]|jgi:hypothetical protein
MPEEVAIHRAKSVGGVIVQDGLTFCVARLDGRALALPPVRFSQSGVPHYDLEKTTLLAEGVQPPASSGGDQVLLSKDGDAVVTLDIES